jgi:hypothetical protein
MVKDANTTTELALQVQALIGTVNNLVNANQHNTREIANAFMRVDMHQQVLQRVVRDITDVLQDATLNSYSAIKLSSDGALDLHAYYEEWRKAAVEAGDKGDVATVLWSQGESVEDAVTRAKLSPEDRTAEQPAADNGYEVEHFGGNLGKDHHQQVTPNPEESR